MMLQRKVILQKILVKVLRNQIILHLEKEIQAPLHLTKFLQIKFQVAQH